MITTGTCTSHTFQDLIRESFPVLSVLTLAVIATEIARIRYRAVGGYRPSIEVP